MFKKVNDFIMAVKIGDTGFAVSSLPEYGVHPEFTSQSISEAFVVSLNPLLEGKVISCATNMGLYSAVDFISPNDTGVAISKTYSISFKDVPMTCKFIVPFVSPLKIKEVGQLLKTLDFYNNGVKLIIKGVKVSM
ncbi:MAG: hypothetical protein NTX05_06045 [Fusobacteria bacterium]|nr:hypothetical protein [Fusobacteriota bacterium]